MHMGAGKGAGRSAAAKTGKEAGAQRGGWPEAGGRAGRLGWGSKEWTREG